MKRFNKRFVNRKITVGKHSFDEARKCKYLGIV